MLALIAAAALAAAVAPTAAPAENTAEFEANLAQVLEDWVSSYVQPIITPEEVDLFRGLGSSRDRLAFVERFWLRRDPTPGSPANEYREEYRRRFVTVSRSFGSGRPGHLTDRGRVFLLLGPPRSAWQDSAGADRQGFPTEVWSYDGLSGVRLSGNLDLTFVDLTGTRDYKLVSDRTLAFTTAAGVRGRGLDQYARLAPDGTFFTGAGGYGGLADRGGELGFLDRLAAIDRLAAPEEPAPAAGLVSTEVAFARLDVRANWAIFRGEGDRTLLAVTFDVDPAGLDRGAGGAGGYAFDCYGALEGPDGRLAATYEERIEIAAPDGAGAGDRLCTSFGLLAPPGRYSLKLALVDARSRRAGGLARPVELPAFPEGLLALSSVVLVAGEDRLPGDTGAGDPFRIGPDLRLIPALDQRIAAGTALPVYLLAYDIPAGGVPLAFALLHPDGRPALVLPPRTLAGEPTSARTAVLAVRTELPTAGLAPATYRLRITAGSGATAAASELELEILPGPGD